MVNVYFKIFIFFVILVGLSFVPIFVKFSVAESVYEQETETKYFFDADYELANFYKAVSNKELIEKTPPYYLAPILNVVLLIIYPIIIFAILNTIMNIARKRRDNPERLFENYN
ncbi:MAG: hypothetical protein ABIH37_03050 [archaeon]